MRYYKYIIHSYRCVLGFMANGEVQEILNFSLHDSKIFAILRALSGKKVMKQKTEKGTDRNEQRNDNSLCNGWFGYGNSCFAYAKLSNQRLFRFCRESYLSKVSFSCRKIFYDLQSFDKKVVNSKKNTKQSDNE